MGEILRWARRRDEFLCEIFGRGEALNKVNEKINLPTSKLKELKNILSRMYTVLQELFEAKQQVCMFISLGMKKYSSIGVRQQKEKQSKTKIAERSWCSVQSKECEIYKEGCQRREVGERQALASLLLLLHICSITYISKFHLLSCKKHSMDL